MSNAMPTITANTPANKPTAEEERQKAIARESGLKQSVAELENFSVATTKRLDDTYYSVLEKLGTLQSTVAALKELAGLSNQMNHTFTTEAEELAADVGSQLDAFGQFDEQQKRVEKLQGRIHVGREKIKVLSKRVDVVRERIENWERADREWQEKTRKRLKAVWVVTSILAFILVLLFVSAQYAPEGLEETTARLANGSLNTIRDMARGQNNILWAERNTENGEAERPPNRTESGAAASATSDILAVFDEL